MAIQLAGILGVVKTASSMVQGVSSLGDAVKGFFSKLFGGKNKQAAGNADQLLSATLNNMKQSVTNGAASSVE
jgi:Flp pilus assembly pilin Flp